MPSSAQEGIDLATQSAQKVIASKFTVCLYVVNHRLDRVRPFQLLFHLQRQTPLATTGQRTRYFQLVATIDKTPLERLPRESLHLLKRTGQGVVLSQRLRGSACMPKIKLSRIDFTATLTLLSKRKRLLCLITVRKWPALKSWSRQQAWNTYFCAANSPGSVVWPRTTMACYGSISQEKPTFTRLRERGRSSSRTAE